jgi:hypothetical protein
MQLSAKALLKPFSASLKDNDTTEGNDDEAENDLEPFDEGDDEEEEGMDEPMDDDDDEDEEDQFEMMDETEREQLLKDTAAVRTTLNKVCIYLSLLKLLMPTHTFRLENFLLPLSILPPSHCLHGARPAPPINFPSASFHAM